MGHEPWAMTHDDESVKNAKSKLFKKLLKHNLRKQFSVVIFLGFWFFFIFIFLSVSNAKT